MAAEASDENAQQWKLRCIDVILTPFDLTADRLLVLKGIVVRKAVKSS